MDKHVHVHVYLSSSHKKHTGRAIGSAVARMASDVISREVGGFISRKVCGVGCRVACGIVNSGGGRVIIGVVGGAV